ncbi:N-acetylmuramoyl-L-alanine amidase protein, partial [human gut metagenome]
PSATYGEEVNKLYKSLLVFAGIEKEEVVSLQSEILSINTNVNNSINVTSNIGWKKENNFFLLYFLIQ